MSAFTRARSRAPRSVFMSRGVAVILAATILVSGGGIANLATAAPASAASTQTEIDAAIAQILRETNAERTKVGLKPLLIAPSINTVAQNWSEAMAAKQTMTHNSAFTSQMPTGWMGA